MPIRIRLALACSGGEALPETSSYITIWIMNGVVARGHYGARGMEGCMHPAVSLQLIASTTSIHFSCRGDSVLISSQKKKQVHMEDHVPNLTFLAATSSLRIYGLVRTHMSRDVRKTPPFASDGRAITGRCPSIIISADFMSACRNQVTWRTEDRTMGAESTL